MPPRPISATVLICTYNRAGLLRETLDSLRNVRSPRTWDVMVVDNNSTDATRDVVAAMAGTFPVPLAYVFEGRQGKSMALNTGISASRGEVIVFTDDDVQVAPNWLDDGCAPLERDATLDYTGGPVRPLWGAPPPAWIDQTRSDLWGTLAILDYGPDVFVFEERQRVPLGVNMAVRRSLFERIGGFHPDLGRRGRSLLGQEQAEFFARGRAAGARGVYVPTMEVHHHVPRERLNKHYFRRWWFWKGVSRARVDSVHRRTELGLDLQSVPYLAGVPRFIWGLLLRHLGDWAAARISGDTFRAARNEMHFVYAIGYIRACWGGLSRIALPQPGPQQPASVSR